MKVETTSQGCIQDISGGGGGVSWMTYFVHMYIHHCHAYTNK